MNNINPSTPKKEKEEPEEESQKGQNSPGVDEASEQGMQEAEFGERSYASPNFNEKDDNSAK